MPIQHEAQQVSAQDFKKFTYILASDEANLRALERIKPRDATAELRLWGSYLDNKAIPDPYYGGMVSRIYMWEISWWLPLTGVHRVDLSKSINSVLNIATHS